MRVIVAEDLTKELREFLEAEGALEAFLKNWNEFIEGRFDIQVEEEIFALSVSGKDQLWRPFMFNRTPEGDDYWYPLAEKFEENYKGVEDVKS